MVLLRPRCRELLLRPDPRVEPWNNLSSFVFTIDQNLHKDKLIQCLRLMRTPDDANHTNGYLDRMLVIVNEKYTFVDLYQYIAQKTNDLANPLYNPYHFAPGANVITQNIRQLIDWCNMAVPFLEPGTLRTHRVA